MDKKQISEAVYSAYQRHGMYAACEEANKHDLDYEECKGCETDTPVIDHVCLVCGQQTNIVYENKFCKIVLEGTYYILQSKSGKYNDQYFLTLPEAKKAIGVN